MPESAIEAERLSKRYLLGQDAGPGSLRDAFAGLLRGSRRSGARDFIWSLKDVSFSVPAGSALGVIGRNGAGKSTLLRVVSRITEPTSGVCRTRGRVGALLEIGAGFHPELTGRENIYLNGAILGMRSAEVRARFDEIVDFSGLERFIDTPVKRYSTGMYLRLAFAVAAHIDTEILVVDEVLAVGDAEFQRKCMTRVLSAEQEGRTVVFVSHDLDAVARLCRTTIWLDQGQIVMNGPTPAVVDRYLASGVQRQGRRKLSPSQDQPVQLQEVAILDDEGNDADVLRQDRPFTVEVTYVVYDRIPGLDMAVSISNVTGTRIVEESFSSNSSQPDRGQPGRYRATLTVPAILRSGNYGVSIWFGSAYDDTLVWEESALTFGLQGNPADRSNRMLDLGLGFCVERISD
jgi:ABC-type polysaccharide/polyol phosphate transport system ATPase subunit